MTSIVNPNVKVTAKVERSMWEQLRYEGKRRGMTASQVLTLAVENQLDHWELEKKMLSRRRRG